MSESGYVLPEFVEVTQEQFSVLAELLECTNEALNLRLRRDLAMLRARRMGLKVEQIAKEPDCSLMPASRRPPDERSYASAVG